MPLGVRFWIGMALLYGGPVLAGWAGSPLTLAPLFAMIFLAWLLLARPALRRPAMGWAHPAIWGQLALAMLVQIVLALGCLALGAGLRHLFGGPELAAIWLFAMSALSLVQAPRLAPLNDPAFQETLDDMLQTLESLQPIVVPDHPNPTLDVEFETQLDHALTPDVAQAGLGQGDLQELLELALDQAGPALLGATAKRAMGLLQLESALVCEMPDPEAIRNNAAFEPDPDAAQALLDWAEAIEAIHNDWASDTSRPV